MREREQHHFKKYLMAIKSYFEIPSKKRFLETNLNKKNRQSNAVVTYCAMKGKLLIRTVVSSFDHAYKAILKHRVPVILDLKSKIDSICDISLCSSCHWARFDDSI